MHVLCWKGARWPYDDVEWLTVSVTWPCAGHAPGACPINPPSLVMLLVASTGALLALVVGSVLLYRSRMRRAGPPASLKGKAGAADDQDCTDSSTAPGGCGCGCSTLPDPDPADVGARSVPVAC